MKSSLGKAPVLAVLTGQVAWADTMGMDEASMLQMPALEKHLIVDTSDCRCPGYVQEECEAEHAQGCRWSDAGESNAPWCQCLGEPIDDPPPAGAASGPWTLILQYGSEPYAPTPEAVGVLDEGASNFAKLSDVAINSLPSGGDSNYNYFKLTAIRPHSSTRDHLILRTTGMYDDMAQDLGFGSFTHCLEPGLRVGVQEDLDDVSLCPEWSNSNSYAWFDTEHGSANDCANRWFTGYGSNNQLCHRNDNRYTHRCFSAGGTCADGSFRTDLKMYKFTGALP